MLIDVATRGLSYGHGQRFCVNILAADKESVCRTFARLDLCYLGSLTWEVRVARNRNFCTLPLGVVGSSLMRRIWRGTLNDASRAAACSRSSTSVAVEPGRTWAQA